MKEYQDIIRKTNRIVNNVGKEKIILLVIAVIFLICSSYFSSGKVKNEKSKSKEVEKISCDNYKDTIEKQLEELIGQIKGVGNVHVLVSLESSSEKILQTDSDYSDTSEKNENTDKASVSKKKNTVIIQNNSDESPYIIKEYYPKISGIAIVLENISSSRKEEIINMVTSLYDVEIHKVSVICSD